MIPWYKLQRDVKEREALKLEWIYNWEGEEVTDQDELELLQDAVDILESVSLSGLTNWDSVQIRVAIRHIKQLMYIKRVMEVKK